MEAGVGFPLLCLLTVEPASCFHKGLGAASARLAAPPVVFFFLLPAQKERQSLAGAAGCLGNTLCHSSGLEQELAYPCQSAGRIWAMPCVNRLSDFHSDVSGIGPPILRSLEKRPQPASLWKPPELSTLLPFPVLITHSFVLLFFSPFLPYSSSASPSSLDSSSPPFCLSVSHSLFILKRWKLRFFFFLVSLGLMQRPSLALPPPTTTFYNSALHLPSIVSPPEREYCVFDA